MCNQYFPFNNQDGLQCGRSSWFTIRLIFTWLFAIFLAVILISITASYYLNGSISFGLFQQAMNGSTALIIFLIGSLILIPFIIYFIFKLVIWWIKRLLCPIICPIVAALKGIISMIETIMRQIDDTVASVNTFTNNFTNLFNEIGNVKIPDITTNLRPITDAVLGASMISNLTGIDPKIVDGAIDIVENDVKAISTTFTGKVSALVASLGRFSDMLLVIKTPLSGIYSFLEAIVRALECFCCCDEHKHKYPSPKYPQRAE